MNQPVAIHWFRQDLRLKDNPSLCYAISKGVLLPVYILDDENAGDNKMGGASRWWLHHSLQTLNESLDGKLVFLKGNAETLLPELVKQVNAISVSWNRCYEPWRIRRDAYIKEKLKSSQVEVESFNGSLLWEPWEIHKADGKPYQVFTPFYRRGCLSAPLPREPLAAPHSVHFAVNPAVTSLQLEELKLLPDIPWDASITPHWTPGEGGAAIRLQRFLTKGLFGYKEGRNLPAVPHVSRLSPHLHFGELSPNQVWYAAQSLSHETKMEKDLDTFLSEIGWREFSYSLLYYHQDLPTRNLHTKFDVFPWRNDGDALKRWQEGQTGYPIVDAGMRELWQTGYMHNRVRMIVGSFLVKNLLLDWRLGERWFWDCLLDADLANNSASWQWVAGCGADASPYFRIFNPVTQGEKFDKEGEYTRHYVPELKDLPDKYLFCPWEAPALVLKAAGITIGKTYPKPIVDVKASRERALQAFTSIKQ